MNIHIHIHNSIIQTPEVTIEIHAFVHMQGTIVMDYYLVRQKSQLYILGIGRVFIVF